MHVISCGFFFFQAEDGIRDLVRSRGLGDVYKRQAHKRRIVLRLIAARAYPAAICETLPQRWAVRLRPCLLYTSDAADERSSVDLGGRRIIKKKKRAEIKRLRIIATQGET